MIHSFNQFSINSVDFKESLFGILIAIAISARNDQIRPHVRILLLHDQARLDLTVRRLDGEARLSIGSSVLFAVVQREDVE